MKRLIALIVSIALIYGTAFAADSTLPALTADATPAATDILYKVNAAGDTERKVTIQNAVNAGLAAPGAIGGTTPAAGTFTTVVGAPLGVEVTGTGSLTDAQVCRTVVSNYGMAAGGDTTLPAYAGRTTFTIVTEAASQAWSLKPPSGEAFVLDGTPLTADYEIDIGQVVGDSGVLIRIRTGAGAYQWHFRTISGTHSDGGAS